MARRGRYQPLLAVLAALPEAQASISFSLTELEELLGTALPATAKTSSGYWSGGSVAEANWLSWGFVGRFHRATQTVVFVRQEP